MRLTARLLLAAAVAVAVLVAFGAATVGTRVQAAERTATVDRLRAEAAVSARLWAATAAPRKPAAAADADVQLADSLAILLGRHVTFIDASGRVRGDSEARDDELRDSGATWLAGYARLPEVLAATRDTTGAAHVDASSATGASEYAAAARGTRGVVRVAAAGVDIRPLTDSLRRGVFLAGLVGLTVAGLGALLLARS
ncbi:MAG TPA: hypothetical protein VGD56_22525, partial [Gemmatirosa sp.]